MVHRSLPIGCLDLSLSSFSAKDLHRLAFFVAGSSAAVISPVRFTSVANCILSSVTVAGSISVKIHNNVAVVCLLVLDLPIPV